MHSPYFWSQVCLPPFRILYFPGTYSSWPVPWRESLDGDFDSTEKLQFHPMATPAKRGLLSSTSNHFIVTSLSIDFIQFFCSLIYSWYCSFRQRGTCTWVQPHAPHVWFDSAIAIGITCIPLDQPIHVSWKIACSECSIVLPLRAAFRKIWQLLREWQRNG